MPEVAESSGRSVLCKCAAAVVLLLITVVLFSKIKSKDKDSVKNPAPPLLEWTNPDHPGTVMTNGLQRLAVMESFAGLDSHIANQCFSRWDIDPRQFRSERQHQIAARFLKDMDSYQSAEQLTAFIDSTKEIIGAPPGEVTPATIKKYSSFAGSQPVLENKGDPEVLQITYQIASHRLNQLNASEQIQRIHSLMQKGLLKRLEESGVALTPADPQLTSPSHVLRYWELTGTRYVLCQTGNQTTSRYIQSQFPDKHRPVYLNALNAVLDPLQRRFKSIGNFKMNASDESTGLKLRESPDGALALLIFEGSLPRAKLYADWRQGINTQTAREILFSPGFLPATQVVLQTGNQPEPQRSGHTHMFPDVNLTIFRSAHAVLKIPPIKFNAMLLLNVPFSAGWQASLSGKSTPVLSANLDACAIYLEASAKERTVEFKK